MSIAFFLSRKLTYRDTERFGFKKFKKEKVFIFDFSDLLKHKSKLFQNKTIRYKNYFVINDFSKLNYLLKKNDIKFGIDFLEKSLKDNFIRFFLFTNKVKLIKYIVGLKSPIIYGKIKKNFSLKITILNLIKKIINKIKIFLFKKIFSKIYWAIVISGKKINYYENFISHRIIKIYSHSLDYNNYLDLKNASNKTKKIVTFVDQNLAFHQDFVIKNKKPIVSAKNYYYHLFKYFNFIEQKYKVKVVIASHPKKGLKNKYLTKSNCRIFFNKTPELIKQSKFVIMHYSTAVSYGILFKKPILFITNNELKKNRQGYQINNMAKLLGSKVINIEKNFKKIKLKINLKKYKHFKDDYLKYPKTEEINSWKKIENVILKNKND